VITLSFRAAVAVIMRVTPTTRHPARKYRLGRSDDNVNMAAV